MSSGPGAGMGYGGYSGTAQQIEGQNDERLSGLLGKVKSLKDVSRYFHARVSRYSSIMSYGLGGVLRASGADIARSLWG